MRLHLFFGLLMAPCQTMLQKSDPVLTDRLATLQVCPWPAIIICHHDVIAVFMTVWLFICHHEGGARSVVAHHSYNSSAHKKERITALFLCVRKRTIWTGSPRNKILGYTSDDTAFRKYSDQIQFFSFDMMQLYTTEKNIICSLFNLHSVLYHDRWRRF